MARLPVLKQCSWDKWIQEWLGEINGRRTRVAGKTRLSARKAFWRVTGHWPARIWMDDSCKGKS